VGLRLGHSQLNTMAHVRAGFRLHLASTARATMLWIELIQVLEQFLPTYWDL
jgi:hypothetical protein